MKDKKIIDNRYIKDKTLGTGGEGVAYLVLDKETQKQYVAKIIEQKDNKEKIEYVKDKKFEKDLEEIKRMFNKISLIQSPYIICCIKEGKGNITLNNEILKNRNYFIFEYASRGDLYKIIKITGGFGERPSKLIFKKILLGVQALHNAHIYHLDLKTENIVIDDQYNPKICDYGFATDQQGLLTDSKGSDRYLAPQKFLKQTYSGEKADIFSLGCILFLLVLGGFCFGRAKYGDKYYQDIINRNEKKFYEDLSGNYNEIKSLKNDFKDLVYTMIAFKEDERPENIEKILEDKWFDEIRNLNDENEKKLEEEVKAKFIEKENIIKEQYELNPYLFEQLGYISSGDNKGVSKKEENIYFEPNFNLENKKIELNGEFYLKLLGKFDYCAFMNNFVNNIIKKYSKKDENCFITNIKNYKCNIEFQKDEDENEDEEANNNNNEDLIIRLNLYRSGEEELILRFLRKKGDLMEYNEKVLEIISLAKELYKKK